MSDRQKSTKKKRFRNLLEAFEPRRPRRGAIVNGRVLRIDPDAILLDVGAHQDAVVPRKELNNLSQEELDEIKVGDQMPVYIVRTARWGGDLVASIERGREQEDWERAEQVLANAEMLDLEVVGENRGGVVVRFGRLQGFVPNSHLPGLRGRPRLQKREHKRSLIGSKLPLNMLEVNPKRGRLVLTGREAHRQKRAQRLHELQPGQIVEGRVVNLVDFGAFVDLGAVDGLLHISEVSHRNDLEHPSEELELGQTIEVLVKEVDVDRERIKLSLRDLSAEGSDEWEDVVPRGPAGDQDRQDLAMGVSR